MARCRGGADALPFLVPSKRHLLCFLGSKWPDFQGRAEEYVNTGFPRAVRGASSAHPVY